MIAVVAVVAIVWVIWRSASDRKSLPCPFWLGRLVELDNPFARENRAREIVGHLAIVPGMRALDIGCGPGRLTIPLARAVGPSGRVIAVDVQPAMLRRTESKVREAGLGNVSFVQAAMGTGALAVAPVDRAVLVTVLGEIPERLGALREIFNALVPGGILSVTETVFDPHYQRRETVEALASEVGFRMSGYFGNRAAYTMHLVKTGRLDQADRRGPAPSKVD